MSLSETLKRLQFGARVLRRGEGGQRDYWKSVATLTSGSFISQGIGIASMLVVARLYVPAEMGAYALFFAYAGLLSLVATAKFDAAVFMARRPSEAADLALLATFISLIVAAAIALLSPVLGFLVTSVTHRPIAFLLLLALGTATGGMMMAVSALAMQVKEFALVTQGRMAQSLVTAALAIGLGLAGWDATGLIVALVGGQAVVCVMLGWRLSILAHARRFGWREARTRARRNARFPQYMLLGEGMNYFGNNALAFVTPGLFGAASLGQFNLGQRVAGIPIYVIGTSMAGIFRTAISPQHAAPSEILGIFRSSFVRLCAIGAVLTLPLLLAGPLLFRIAFGAQWHDAGFYVQIISPLIFLRFVVSPLSVVLLLANRQRLDMVLQALFVAAAFAAVGFGAWTGSFLHMVIAATALQSAVYAVYLAVSYKLAKDMSKQ
jgi:O-antigen/teichoic acid export membrane protein